MRYTRDSPRAARIFAVLVYCAKTLNLHGHSAHVP